MSQSSLSDARSEYRALLVALSDQLGWYAASGATGLPASATRDDVGMAASGVGARLAVPSAEALPPRELAPGAPPHQGERPPLVPEPSRRTEPPVSAAPESPRTAASDLDTAERRERLRVLENQVKGCTRCGLSATRTQTVFARGDGSSRICFVGEGPGADEDAQGFPFVGKAGLLLDRMIAAMGLFRDEVYVCNIVKCRPPNNRKPAAEEMAACMPYLAEQLELIEPEVIIALGATAVQGLFGTTEGITRLRGRWRLYKGKIAVMPTFHPAYLLRSPAAKRQVWEDLQAVLRQLGRPIPERGSKS